MGRWSRGCTAAVIGAALTLAGCPALGPVVPLPAAAQVVGVLRCIPSMEQVAGDGEYAVSLQQRATGARVSAFMSALALPSMPRTDQACSGAGVGPVAVELETSSGAVTVAPPLDPCLRPRSEVRASFDALSRVTVTTTRGAKLRSDEAVKTGCPSFKDLIALDAGDAQPGAAGPVLGEGAAVSVCVFRSSGGDGYPTGGGQLTADQVQRLAALLASAGPAAPCATSHASFAVVTATGTEAISAELDGCVRATPTSPPSCRRTDAHEWS